MDAPATTPSARPLVVVHVLGAVTAPGVYELESGSRVVDAIDRAGGLSASADAGSVNLARPLADGEQLRVLAVGEAPVAGAPGPAPAAAPDGVAGPAAGGAASGPLDLNRATALDLEELPRIGPAMAARIIAWRDENGGFTAVDDLLQITGIGDKTFEGLRELVRV
jgi:competence protein ComEA